MSETEWVPAAATVMGGRGDLRPVAHGDDQNFIVEFYTREIEDEAATKAHGRVILRAVSFCRKYAIGDARTVWDAPVSEEDKMRWPNQYRAFEAGEKVSEVGTPLDAWPLMNRDMKIALKNAGFKTVEQIAAVDDGALAQMDARLGNLIQKVQANAQKFINDQEAGEAERRMADQLEERDNEIGALKQQMADMAAAMERMRAEQLAAPITKPEETAPGYQQPPSMPVSHETADPADAGLEALEELPEVEPVAEPPKRRGRPLGSKNKPKAA